MSAEGPRKRSRREVVPRRLDDEAPRDSRDGSFSSMTSLSVGAAAAAAAANYVSSEHRNAMRNLPDPKHFPEMNGLMKSEIKKDMREMERDAVCLAAPSKSLHQPMRLPIQSDVLPPSLPDTQTSVKRRRYYKWDANPETIQPDLDEWRTSIDHLRENLSTTASDRAEVQEQHRTLNGHLSALFRLLQRERWEGEIMYRTLQALSIRESLLFQDSKKRKQSEEVAMRDVLKAVTGQQERVSSLHLVHERLQERLRALDPTADPLNATVALDTEAPAAVAAANTTSGGGAATAAAPAAPAAPGPASSPTASEGGGVDQKPDGMASEAANRLAGILKAVDPDMFGRIPTYLGQHVRDATFSALDHTKLHSRWEGSTQEPHLEPDPLDEFQETHSHKLGEIPYDFFLSDVEAALEDADGAAASEADPSEDHKQARLVPHGSTLLPGSIAKMGIVAARDPLAFLKSQLELLAAAPEPNDGEPTPAFLQWIEAGLDMQRAAPMDEDEKLSTLEEERNVLRAQIRQQLHAQVDVLSTLSESRTESGSAVQKIAELRSEIIELRASVPLDDGAEKENGGEEGKSATQAEDRKDTSPSPDDDEDQFHDPLNEDEVDMAQAEPTASPTAEAEGVVQASQEPPPPKPSQEKETVPVSQPMTRGSRAANDTPSPVSSDTPGGGTRPQPVKTRSTKPVRTRRGSR